MNGDDLEQLDSNVVGSEDILIDFDALQPA